jgi:hypothetical protein
MRLGIDSKREALEALRAVINWTRDGTFCAADEYGSTIVMHLEDAEHFIRDHARDRDVFAEAAREAQAAEDR